MPYQHVSYSDPDGVVVRGERLTDLMGEITFGDMVFLGARGRRPDEAESTLFNAVLVSLAEYGLSASAIAARLTVRGAPGAVQGAIAAGILGVGDKFIGAVEETGRMLQPLVMAASGDSGRLEQEIDDLLRRTAQDKSARIPGLGHPDFKESDPRSKRLEAIARSVGVECMHFDALNLVRDKFEQTTGKRLPINVDGAVGAILSDLGFPWRGCRGIAVVARAGGLVGHVLDELREETSGAILQAAQAAVVYR